MRFFILFALVFGVISVGVVARFFEPNKRYFQYLLAFTGTIILSLVVFHLLPEIYQAALSTPLVGYGLLAGFMTQLTLDFFSKGIEHGHVHYQKNVQQFFPWSIFISLCLHALVEGFPISRLLFGATEDCDYALAIIIHNIPIAMILAVLLRQHRYYFAFLCIFAFMAPLGAVADYWVGHLWLEPRYSLFTQSLVAGMLLHISTLILLENDTNHRFDFARFSCILVGFLIGIFIFN